LLAIYIILLFFPTISFAGEVDTTPPQLISLEFDKEEVEAGDTITVTAKVTDDLSGVSSVYVYFEGNVGEQLPEIRLYKTEEDTYKGILRIGKYEEPRTLKVRAIEVFDNVGNFRWYEPDEDYSFTVINNGEVDTTPPQLISVEFDKIEVEAGDTITVTAKGTDDISGVSSIYVYFEGNTGQQLPGISLYKTDKADTYKGIVRIGKYEEPGIRKLTRIEMQDNAGNRKSYTPAENYIFNVINNGEVDTTPPKLISLEI
ncbi:Ig-like domain-containing protein, partial [Vibrio parahaemolyticus]|nr:Ig-like domain-containing protein [Vibrio parahaemolyticus]